MTWILLSLCSAVFLGGYEIAKKLTLRSLASFQALFWSSLINAALMIPELVLWAPALSLRGHLWILLKSFVVSCSWVCAFAAMKNLPISVVTPMRAFSPVFTGLAGILFLGEWLRAGQWMGILICSFGFVRLARLSANEGIVWRSNKWVFVYVISLSFGVCASITDKTIMTIADLPGTSLDRARLMQIWFSLYTPLLLAPIYWFSINSQKQPSAGRTPLRTFAYLPLISIFLIAADRCYFTALGDSDALIGVVSCVRQTCIIVSAIGGGWLLGDVNLRRKAASVLVIAAGLCFLLIM